MHIYARKSHVFLYALKFFSQNSVMRLPRRPPIAVAFFAGSLLCNLPFLRGENVSPVPSLHQWSVIETARDNGHRLANLTPPAVSARSAEADADFVCRPETRYQSIEGFGGALTESTAYVLTQLPASTRAAILKAYFDPQSGIGYTLCRTHINSCDFSLTSWSLDETAGDVELKHFDLTPMRKWLLPVLHQAYDASGSRIRFLVSPWSPPAWMKTNGEMSHGGELKPEDRGAWAAFIAKFITVMDRDEHLPIRYLTVQNEPAASQTWESCLYTAEQERDFVRDHLGPTLAKAGLSEVHLLIWDHNRDLLWARASTVLKDQATAQYVWGTGVHWYAAEHFDQEEQVHAAFPDKALLFTEGCWEGGAKPGQWDRGERYAHNVIGDLTHWCTGWIDWNLVLDLKGGPNHVGNLCDAPILADPATGNVVYQTSFYYLGQFAKFVRPGAVRIGLTSRLKNVEAIAFQNPDGSVVTVISNASDNDASGSLALGSERVHVSVPGHAIQTLVANNR